MAPYIGQPITPTCFRTCQDIAVWFKFFIGFLILQLAKTAFSQNPTKWRKQVLNRDHVDHNYGALTTQTRCQLKYGFSSRQQLKLILLLKLVSLTTPTTVRHAVSHLVSSNIKSLQYPIV